MIYKKDSKGNNVRTRIVFYHLYAYTTTPTLDYISRIRYSLVVILELNGVSEVQYKGVMMIDGGKYQ